MTTDFDAGFILGCQVGDGYDTGIYDIGSTIKDTQLSILGPHEVWRRKDAYPTNASHFFCVAVDKNGNVYTAGAGKVYKYDINGNVVWSIVQDARGIAVDNDGNVYLVDGDWDVVLKVITKLSSSGTEIWSITGLGFGKSIAVSNGYIYVAYAASAVGKKCVQKLDSSGNEIWSKSDIKGGHDIAVDNAGNVYVVHNNYHTDYTGEKTVRKLDFNGNEIWSANKYLLFYAYAVAVDDLGNMYIMYRNSALHKLDPAGNVIWIKHDAAYGWGVAVDSSYNVYAVYTVAESSSTEIEMNVRKLDSSGNELYREQNQFPTSALDLAADDNGYIYVSYYTSVGLPSLRKVYLGPTVYTVAS